MPITYNTKSRTIRLKSGETKNTVIFTIRIPDTIENAEAIIKDIVTAISATPINVLAIEPVNSSRGLGLSRLSLDNMVTLTNALKNCVALDAISLANNRLDFLEPHCFSTLIDLIQARRNSLVCLRLINTGLNALGEPEMQALCNAIERSVSASLRLIYIGGNFIDAYAGSDRPIYGQANEPSSAVVSESVAALASALNGKPVATYEVKSTADLVKGVSETTNLCDSPEVWQMSPLSCRNVGKLMDSLAKFGIMLVKPEEDIAQIEEKVRIDFRDQHSSILHGFVSLYSQLQRLVFHKRFRVFIQEAALPNGQQVVVFSGPKPVLTQLAQPTQATPQLNGQAASGQAALAAAGASASGDCSAELRRLIMQGK